MPDNEITLKDIFEKLVRIEAKLNDLTTGKTMDSGADFNSPFLNPDTGLYDMKYYRRTQTEEEKDK